MLRKSNSIQIAVDDILEGMFIAELDMPWEKSSFILQGFLAEADNIEILKSKCTWVLVSKQHSVAGLFAQDAVETIKITESKAEPVFSARSGFFIEIKSWLPNVRSSNALVGFGALLASFLLKSDRPLKNERQFSGMPYSHTEMPVQYTTIPIGKMLRARRKFKDDSLVTKLVVNHETTSALSDEYEVAQNSVVKLNAAVASRLFGDVSTSNAMDLVMNETKESVGDIVDSMINNPDAMRLVDGIRRFDNHAYKHAVDVCILMIAFGREMNLPKDVLVELGLGGLLHDIGEVKPPSGSQVKLHNIAMYHIYKEHVGHGIKLVEKSSYSDIVKSIIAEHHERYDGTGYPKGLGNLKRPKYGNNYAREGQKKISMYGLMIAIVDSYVSMVDARSSLQPLSPNVAMAHIVKHAGTHFEPALVDIFSQVIGVYPVGSYVQLATGEIGMVIKQNRAWRLTPVVQVIADRNKNKIAPYYIDLLTQVEFSIKKEVVFKGGWAAGLAKSL